MFFNMIFLNAILKVPFLRCMFISVWLRFFFLVIIQAKGYTDVPLGNNIGYGYGEWEKNFGAPIRHVRKTFTEDIQNNKKKIKQQLTEKYVLFWEFDSLHGKRTVISHKCSWFLLGN